MPVRAIPEKHREPPEARENAHEIRYDALLEATPDLVVRIDANGAVLDYKGTHEARWVGSGAGLLAKTLGDVVPDHAVLPLLQVIRSVLGTRTLETFEYCVSTGSGPRYREARVVAAGHDNVVTVIRDVTEQRLAQAEILAHVARVEMLDAISQAFAGATLDYGAALDMAVRRTSELIGDACVIAELTQEETALRPIAAHDRTASVREALARLLDKCALPAREGLLEPVLELGDTLLCNDVADAEVLALFGGEAAPGAQSLGVHALLAVPMRALGRITGVLLLMRHRSGRRYRDEDVVFAQAIADRAGVAIHSAHLYADNLRQAHALRTMNRDLELRIAERTFELERANELLRQQAIEDPLTGLANRRQFATVFELELRRARRQGAHLTLLMADVDFFKPYNDLYGHPQGDQCLRRVAEVLKNTFRRAGDLAARYGGEEFTVVLPGCPADAARIVSERFRAGIEAMRIPHERSTVSAYVTVSVGVGSARVGSTTDPDRLLKAADEALYRAKADGRNRVMLSVLD